MDDFYTNLLIHIGALDEETNSYPVDAQLDTGARFKGGELRLEQQALLESELDPTAYGTLLYRALFSEPIRRAYDVAQGLAAARSKGRVRLRLWIDEGAPALHALPWERLAQIEGGELAPLSISAATPFSRYMELELGEPEPLHAPTIRLLVAISNPTSLPKDLASLDVAREVQTLRDALGNLHARGFLEVTILAGRTGLPDALAAQLEADGYHLAAGPTTLGTILHLLPSSDLFHFVGHGAFRGSGTQASTALFLENEQGALALAKDAELVPKIRALNPRPQLIYLSACESAKRDGTHPFVGLAPRLVRVGIPAVVAMQEQVPIHLAQQLTGDFYHHLLEHGRVDVALNQARLYLYQHDATNWAIPVLYMRAPDGRLFDLETPLPAPPVSDTPAPPSFPPAANAARERPARGGVSIGHYESGAGTLGCLVRKRGEPNGLYLLSDANVLMSPHGPPTAGSPIFQPGPGDADNSVENLLANLAEWKVVRASPRAARDNLSVAIAKVRRREEVSAEIKGRGFIRGVREATPGTPVFAVGRSSGVASGIVLRVNEWGEVPMWKQQVQIEGGEQIDDNGFVTVPYDGLIVTTALLQAGDSGAILLDEENFALGLGFAGSARDSYFFPLQKVLDALDLEVVTEALWHEEPAAPTPAPVQPAPPAPTLPVLDRRALLALLAEHFNDSELRDLCFVLGVDYDDLGGSGKSAKARELLLFLERRGRLDELAAQIAAQRPELFAASEPTPPVAQPTPVASGYERALRDIADKLARGRMAIFVGAELPEAQSGLPSRQALADALAERHGIARGTPLASVAQQVMQHGNRWEFTNFLKQQLEKPRVAPGPVYQALARVIERAKPEILITTAYHALLERALQAGSVNASVVVQDSALQFVSPDEPTLLKLYGDTQQPDSLVATEQDQNALLRGRFAGKAEMVDELRRAFRRNSVLFVGYDLRDPAVSALFDEVAGDRFQQPAFAIWSDLTAPEAASFASNRGLTVLQADAAPLLDALLALIPADR